MDFRKWLDVADQLVGQEETLLQGVFRLHLHQYIFQLSLENGGHVLVNAFACPYSPYD